MAKCIKCKKEIIVIPYYDDDNVKKEIWLHPKTLENCEYRHDGIEVNVIDTFLQSKFQELIKENEEKGWFSRLKERVSHLNK